MIRIPRRAVILALAIAVTVPAFGERPRASQPLPAAVAMPATWLQGFVKAVSGGGGHYRIDVVSAVFAGKSMLESQRLVLSAIKHLINGDRAPVHAVDALTTRAP